MRNRLPISLLFLILYSFLGCFLMSGCEKDPCKNVSCLNGGACVDGTCACANGYTGVNCQTPPDPCANITCLNGGSCSNGSCVCPPGYTGVNCGQQITPTKIRINRIVVTRFPATDGAGAGWDLTSGPDIYPELSLGSNVVWSSSTYFSDVTSGAYSFDLTPAYDMTSPTSQYTIALYDYDDIDADDLMGGYYFTPYSSTGGFPTTITIDGSGSVGFKLYVSYIF